MGISHHLDIQHHRLMLTAHQHTRLLAGEGEQRPSDPGLQYSLQPEDVSVAERSFNAQNQTHLQVLVFSFMFFNMYFFFSIIIIIIVVITTTI